MSPPISKEWWLAAALTGASVPAALGQPATAPQRQIGVVSAVKPGAQGQPGTVTYAPLVKDGTRDQPIRNDTDGPMHVLFTDQSAITIAPKSALVIKLYEHDAQKKTGNVVIEMAVGLMRYVGGQISKRNGAEIRTSTATIGIRGGISTIDVQGNGQTSATFLFGQQMTMTHNSGSSNTITRPGFGSSIGSGGMGPITRTDPNALRTTLNQLGGGGGGGGGGGQPGGGGAGLNINVSGQTNNDLANNRLNTLVTDRSTNNPSSTLRNVLGSPTPNES